MEANMSPDSILETIRQIADKGESLSKRDVKKQNPDLMKNALYFFPSWEHAVKASTTELS